MKTDFNGDKYLNGYQQSNFYLVVSSGVEWTHHALKDNKANSLGISKNYGKRKSRWNTL